MDPLSRHREDAGVCEEAHSLLLLQRLPGLAGVGVRRLVEAFGTGRRRYRCPVPGTDAAALWDALSPVPEGVDGGLAGRTWLSAMRTLVALSSLEIEGWVVLSAGSRFVRKT